MRLWLLESERSSSFRFEKPGVNCRLFLLLVESSFFSSTCGWVTVEALVSVTDAAIYFERNISSILAVLLHLPN
jgi:hypothetical protein